MTFSTYYMSGRPRFRRPVVVISTLTLLLSLVTLSPVLAAPPAGDLDQCANGGVGSPDLQCIDPPGSANNWQNGNLNGNQAHYNENESVPYRLRMSNLTAGSSTTVTLEWDTSKRKDKVFFDANQNTRGKTLAAQYSPRPTAWAGVSAPITWAELPTLDSTQFNLLTMPDRIASVGDLWADILNHKSDLSVLLSG